MINVRLICIQHLSTDNNIYLLSFAVIYINVMRSSPCTVKPRLIYDLVFFSFFILFDEAFIIIIIIIIVKKEQKFVSDDRFPFEPFQNYVIDQNEFFSSQNHKSP